MRWAEWLLWCERSLVMDVLLKPLSGGEYAVAVLNRSAAPVQVGLHPADLGFSSGCRFEAQDLWSGKSMTGAASLQANVAAHDTAIWKIHPAASCGAPTRTGTITMIASGKHRDIKSYSRCLSAAGSVGDCDGSCGRELDGQGERRCGVGRTVSCCCRREAGDAGMWFREGYAVEIYAGWQFDQCRR